MLVMVNLFLILNIKEYIQNDESFIILGALNAMMAVGTGAFGAHGLEGKLSDKYMSIWEKATTYQMYHGLGLLVIGLISGTTSMNVNWAGWLLFFGIVFSVVPCIS